MVPDKLVDSAAAPHPSGDSPGHADSAIEQALLDAIPASVAHIDGGGRIVAVNQRWAASASGNCLIPAGSVPGSDYLALCEGMPAGEAALYLRETLAGSRESGSFAYPSDGPDGRRWFRAHFAALAVAGERGALAMLADITHEVLAEQKLFDVAHFDALTGLPNRLLFLDRLGNGLAQAQRLHKSVAVLCIDVDRFKVISDSLGRAAGDLLLQGVSRRIADGLRHSDTLGRLDQQKFAVMVAEVGLGSDAGVVARKLMALLEQPFEINGQKVFVSASIGIALAPGDSDEVETLLGFADTAMRRARDAGCNTFRYYTASMNEGALARLSFDSDLHQALAGNEFELFYQPKVSCSNGDIVGLEALLRWRHPVRGLVMPDDFVPALEENGFIISVGQWVLREACRQLKQWHDLGFGRPSVAVNLSVYQLESSELVASVREALAVSGLPADCLELEVTESALLRNVERVNAIMNELRRLGVRFCVENFGTGYASVSYLKRFPLDAIKMGCSVIHDITAEADDVSITRAVIGMAHNLKLKVIAQGVETEGQLALLVANHCDEIQGYFFSHPLPAADIEKILADRCAMPALPAAPSQRERTILIVDDEENILASLRRLLRRNGYRILTATGGEAGLELLAVNEVDVILSDQRMPGMMGVEFLRRVKSLYPQTVRMVLSGYTELQSITDAINEGAIYKFLTKPWDDELLRANIEEAFRYKEMADENRRLSGQVQAVNTQLAEANGRLLQTLGEKERRIERDEMTLDIAQEALQCIPFPVLGVDDEDLVVFANIEAERLLGGGNPLLGSAASDCLPAPLFRLLQGNDGDAVDWVAGRGPLRALYRRMGPRHAESRLLIIFPVTVGG
ncbi:EAL domain-containing protein [Azonexus sp. IMCC34842]|uniref:EAL domain-containing protein n=1 Tax=Azonexus sp. IMCC34842 TaxID=3420950 RepID=UPI003D151639